MSICKGCGAEIRWIRMPSGKAMPVDVPGVPFTPGGGPTRFILENGSITYGVKGRSGPMIGYVPHWSTCPAAGHFKKGGGERGQG